MPRYTNDRRGNQMKKKIDKCLKIKQNCRKMTGRSVRLNKKWKELMGIEKNKTCSDFKMPQ